MPEETAGPPRPPAGAVTNSLPRGRGGGATEAVLRPQGCYTPGQGCAYLRGGGISDAWEGGEVSNPPSPGGGGASLGDGLPPPPRGLKGPSGVRGGIPHGGPGGLPHTMSSASRRAF